MTIFWAVSRRRVSLTWQPKAFQLSLEGQEGSAGVRVHRFGWRGGEGTYPAHGGSDGEAIVAGSAGEGGDQAGCDCNVS